MMREAKVELKEYRLQRTFDALEGPNDYPNDYQMVLGTRETDDPNTGQR
jgi:hypothetical protein